MSLVNACQGCKRTRGWNGHETAGAWIYLLLSITLRLLFMGEIPPQPIRPRVPVCSLKFPGEVFNSGNLGGRLIISSRAADRVKTAGEERRGGEGEANDDRRIYARTRRTTT